MGGHTEGPWSLTYFATEDDGPCDVGIALSLPGGSTLYAGEITKRQWESAGEEAAALGDDCGAWIILYPSDEGEQRVIGKAVHLQDGLGLIYAIHDAGTKIDLPEADADLLAASRKALNFIKNTERELGITLDSGDALRAAIVKAEKQL